MLDDIGIRMRIICWLATPFVTVACLAIADRFLARRHGRGH
jgi:hypothetical protein